jgi:uncharacterized protein YcbK (DUF882 family)
MFLLISSLRSSVFAPKVLRRVALGVAALTFTVITAKTPVRAEAGDSLPTVGIAPVAPKEVKESYVLRLRHLHTGEALNVVYRQGADYSAEGIAKLNSFLRDHRTMDTANYDPAEFDLLHKLMTKLGRPDGEIDIVCGYRTPATNHMLRTRAAFTGVAEHSQHMLSKAIDIRVPGISTRALRDAALSLGLGGVGYYPISQFVHVDVGPVRQWSFGGGGDNLVARVHHKRHKGRARNA